jgi:hypothetical protein
MSALESIASFAGATLEAQLRPPQPEPRSEPQLVQQPAAQVEEALLPALDLRAGRFARVETAKLVLEHQDVLRRGRESRDVYGALQSEIDAVRDEYRRRFPGAADFIHLELVRTLAQNDPEALGGQYPGPLS